MSLFNTILRLHKDGKLEHGDLRPSNVLLGPEPSALPSLIDFTHARAHILPSDGAKVGCPGVGACSELQEAARLLQLGETEVDHAAAQETAAATASLRPPLKSVPNRPRQQELVKEAHKVGSKADKGKAMGATKLSAAVVKSKTSRVRHPTKRATGLPAYSLSSSDSCPEEILKLRKRGKCR